MAQLFNRGNLGAVKGTEEMLGLVNFTTDYEQFRGVDFIVENATEKWDRKKMSMSISTPSALSMSYSQQILQLYRLCISLQRRRGRTE